VVVNDALSHPHKPARLYLRAEPRQAVVRQLQSLGKFEAKMPFGPEPCRVYPEIEAMLQDTTATNDDLCTLFTDRLEAELTDIYGLTPSKAKPFLGRSSGPKFVWRSALDEQIGIRKTTSVSRAWRRTANWLTELNGTKKLVAAKVAVSKILWYSHPHPLKEAATPEQLLGFQTFLNWRGIITAEMLQHGPWIIALRDTALKNAVNEEVAAQAMSIKAWTKWIHEGPAAGLR